MSVWDQFTRRGVDMQRDIEAQHRLIQAQTLGGYTVPNSIPANALSIPVVDEIPDDDDDFGGGGLILLRTVVEPGDDLYSPYIYDYEERRWAHWISGGSNAFTITNWTDDYEYDADATSVDELANVLATFISNGGGGAVVSAGLVQGLNYDYFIHDPSSNYTISASSATALDTTNARLTLDCDGSYPVVVLHGCLRNKGTSNAILTSILSNGSGNAAGNRATYNTSTAIDGDTGLSIFPATAISAGANTFDLAAHVEGGGSGTVYGTGTGNTGNRLWAIAIELKTVEGQITQARVDNRTVTTIPTMITDWSNRPTTPTDGEVIIFNPNSDVGWTMMYDEANNYWLCVGGVPWTQWRYGGLSNANGLYATIAGETISFPSMPGGDYVFQLGFYYEQTIAGSYVGMSVLGDLNTEALNRSESTTGGGNAFAQAQKTITDGQTVVPYWIRTTGGTCFVYRAHMGITPRHLDN